MKRSPKRSSRELNRIDRARIDLLLRQIESTRGEIRRKEEER